MKTPLLILFLVIPFMMYGQEDKANSGILGPRNSPYTYRVDLFVVINNKNIRLDSLTSKKMDPKWIKKMAVIKKKKYKNTYGNMDANVLIYPKHKYLSEICNLIGYKEN